MGILTGIFKSRDKPQNATSGGAYRFFIGGSSSGKNVNERSAIRFDLRIMQQEEYKCF